MKSSKAPFGQVRSVSSFSTFSGSSSGSSYDFLTLTSVNSRKSTSPMNAPDFFSSVDEFATSILTWKDIDSSVYLLDVSNSWIAFLEVL
ncbi:hypothetical protein Ddc_13220 [Ditylenchus destructor]|nr:hypothetical protein Ddc_13220 [Ditylenchus destructor]